jgi:hypothetical protein
MMTIFGAKRAWLKRDAFMRAGLSKRESMYLICSEKGAQVDRQTGRLQNLFYTNFPVMESKSSRAEAQDL